MFVIPNIESAPSFNGQSYMDATDLAILTAALDGTGVVSGCTVSQDTGADMKVGVAAGVVVVAGVQYTVAATGGSPLTVTAASTAGDRRDIVEYTVGTGLVVKAGSAASVGNYPVKPSIDANSVVLAEVYVAQNTTTITSANLTDKTTIVPGSGGASALFAAGTAGAGLSTNTQNVVATLALTAGTWMVTGSVSMSGATNAKQINANLTAATGTMSINNGNGCVGYNDSLASGDTVSIPLQAVVVVTVAGNLQSRIDPVAVTTGTLVTGAAASLFLSAYRIT